MSQENLEKRESCLLNELTSIESTLEDLRNTFRLTQQRHSDYQAKIEHLTKQGLQDLSKSESELEQLRKKREENESFLIQKQRKGLEVTAQLQRDVQKLTESLDSKIEDQQEEINLKNTSLGPKEMWVEEVTSKERSRDELFHVFNRLNRSITAKTQDLEELQARIQTANGERLGLIDMLNNAMQKITLAESVQSKSISSTCDSNSLFNEVNDKRVEMKKSLADLKTKCTDMPKLIESKENERMHLWQLQIDIQNILENHPKEALSEYTALIEKYRSTQESVEEANREYEKLISEKEKLSISANCPDDIFNFNDEFMERKEKTQERLTHLFKMEMARNVTISRQTTESGRKHLRYNTADFHVLKDIAEISSRIEEMEQQALKKENIEPPCEIAKKINAVAPVEKKVMFHETVVSPPARRRGRCIQSKPIHFPNPQ